MTTTMSRGLSALCAQFQRWRQHGGGRGKRVPPALWRQAVTVARVEGAWKTARATRLKYDRLRVRMAEGEAMADPPARSLPSRSPTTRSTRRGRSTVTTWNAPARSASPFVALQMKPAAPAPALTIELISQSGERMRIESAGALDIVGIVQAFWDRS